MGTVSTVDRHNPIDRLVRDKSVISKDDVTIHGELIAFDRCDEVISTPTKDKVVAATGSDGVIILATNDHVIPASGFNGDWKPGKRSIHKVTVALSHRRQRLELTEDAGGLPNDVSVREEVEAPIEDEDELLRSDLVEEVVNALTQLLARRKQFDRLA